MIDKNKITGVGIAIHCKKHFEKENITQFAKDNGFELGDLIYSDNDSNCYLTFDSAINSLFLFNREYYEGMDYKIVEYEDILISKDAIYKEKLKSLSKGLEIENIDDFIEFDNSYMLIMGNAITEGAKDSIKQVEELKTKNENLSNKLNEFDELAFEKIRTITKQNEEIADLKKSIIGLSAIVAKQRETIEEYDSLPF